MGKRFGGSEALRGVDFSVSTGEIVGLVGENGAGKSTLVKILTGVHPPSSGSVQIDGVDVALTSPRDAGERGVAVVHQESQLFPSLRVWENLAVTSGTIPGPGPFVSRAQARAEAQRVLDRFGANIDPNARVRSLLPIEQRLVEIARALAGQPSFLLLDEPTAALERSESRRLLAMLRDLRGQGTGLVLVSHHLEEVEQVSDRVVVLRDGRVAAELGRGRVERATIIESMLGHSVGTGGSAAADDRWGRPVARPQRAAIEIRGLRVLPTAVPTDLVVREGELVAVTGLVGAGTSSLLQHLVGGGPARSSEIRVVGHPARLTSPAAALRHGIGFLSQDRKRSGALPSHSVSWNVGLASLPALCSWGIRRNRRFADRAVAMRDRLGVRCASVAQPMRALSGGNQQKV
ncbi:MAG: sugar ABC transporter ATP-binding protein, partial [Acidimicrobiia bacterium]|nr:sugar ABC transporter ATP-binding protein [Acidimicrobiia bacterium]